MGLVVECLSLGDPVSLHAAAPFWPQGAPRGTGGRAFISALTQSPPGRALAPGPAAL